MNHTPGPWKYLKGTEDDEHRCSVLVDGPKPWIIADIHNGAPGDTCATEEANARLMAAAPDLLAACKKMILMTRAVSDGFSDEFCAKEGIEAIELTMAAILKAEGEIP